MDCMWKEEDQLMIWMVVLQGCCLRLTGGAKAPPICLRAPRIYCCTIKFNNAPSLKPTHQWDWTPPICFYNKLNVVVRWGCEYSWERWGMRGMASPDLSGEQPSSIYLSCVRFDIRHHRRIFDSRSCETSCTSLAGFNP